MLFMSRSDVPYQQCRDVNEINKDEEDPQAKLHIEDHGYGKFSILIRSKATGTNRP